MITNEGVSSCQKNWSETRSFYPHWGSAQGLGGQQRGLPGWAPISSPLGWHAFYLYDLHSCILFITYQLVCSFVPSFNRITSVHFTRPHPWPRCPEKSSPGQQWTPTEAERPKHRAWALPHFPTLQALQGRADGMETPRGTFPTWKRTVKTASACPLSAESLSLCWQQWWGWGGRGIR